MLIRTSLTLQEEDVQLLDRLAALEGNNRSETMRYLLKELRPTLTHLVDTLEAAQQNRERLFEAIADAQVSELAMLMPEVERIDRQVIGALSRLEGMLTAQQAEAGSDPRSGSHGGHKSNPTSRKS